MIRIRIPFFRIFYSTTFTILLLICLALIVITPGDIIRQSIQGHHIANVFIVAGVHILTLILAAFIYASRLLTNRSVLSAIPEPWIPVQIEDVGKKVRRMIVDAWERSAIIAWDARPKHLPPEIEEVEKPSATATIEANASMRHRRHLWHPLSHQNGHIADEDNGNHNSSETAIDVRPAKAPWGPVSHPGWSSPSSIDLPNVYYPTVIAELPNLIEAKAVSLAPPDPVLSMMSQPGNTPRFIPPDPRALALLRRPTSMGLRDYLEYLGQLGLVNPFEVGVDFLTTYEYARFSSRALTESEFRQLMEVFAELLRGMVQLDPVILATLAEEAELDSEYGGESHSSPSSSTSPSSASVSTNASAIRYYPAQSSSGSRSPRSSRSGSVNHHDRSRSPSPSSSILARDRTPYSQTSDQISAHSGRLPAIVTSLIPTTGRSGHRSISTSTAYTAPLPSSASSFRKRPTMFMSSSVPGPTSPPFNASPGPAPGAAGTTPPAQSGPGPTSMASTAASTTHPERTAPRMPSAQSLPATSTSRRPLEWFRRNRQNSKPTFNLDLTPHLPSSSHQDQSHSPSPLSTPRPLHSPSARSTPLPSISASQASASTSRSMSQASPFRGSVSQAGISAGSRSRPQPRPRPESYSRQEYRESRQRSADTASSSGLESQSPDYDDDDDDVDDDNREQERQRYYSESLGSLDTVDSAESLESSESVIRHR